MLGRAPSYLPKRDIISYRFFSFFLYAAFAVMLCYGALSFLFPYQRYSFDFNNPNATKNNLFEPHLKDFTPVAKGKIEAENSLVIYANNPQILESGEVFITPAPGQVPFLEGTQLIVKRGWAATFFPQGEERDIPQKNIVHYQEGYYEWRDNTLYPFVSKEAALSHIPENRITPLAESIFSQLTVSEELVGFRPGTLLAYADGVFVVTEEGTIRPFGSAEVLLRSGYTFDHVLSASGEEVGIYKRGKIILPGELHPSGTLFKDADTDTLYLFENKKIFPLTKSYAQFLSSQNDVITFSSRNQEKSVFCRLSQQFLWNRYSCSFALLELSEGGNDYQFTLTALDHDTDIQTFAIGLQSSRQQENAVATFRSLATRILERLGLY